MTLISQDINNNQKLWLAAIKPPIYSVAIVPITVGTAIAYSHTHVVDLPIGLTFLLSGILIIAWLNISNDVFDADTGIDINKAHSVVNLTGNKSLMLIISNLFLLMGWAGIILICWWQQDWTVLGLVLLCCALGYLYQGPPFRLGYQGLGEFICFLAFGPGAVSAAYYSQTQSFSWSCLAISTIIGVSTSIILFCSHFHQVEDDLTAGKRSPIVRLGTAKGAIVLTILTISIYLLTIGLVAIAYLPLHSLLILLSLPFAYQLVARVIKYHDQPQQVSNSKFLAVNFYLVSAIALIGGLVASSIN